MVATSQGVSVRRVIYQDPETATIYHFLNNLPASIPPGLIAMLYKARWDIGIIEHAIERPTQRTVKFIRSLKNHFDLARDWNQAMARLTEVYARL